MYGRRHGPERLDNRVVDGVGVSPSRAEGTDVGQEVVTCPDCTAENGRGYETVAPA